MQYVLETYSVQYTVLECYCEMTEGWKLETNHPSVTAQMYARESRFDPVGSGHHWRTWGRECYGYESERPGCKGF